MSFTDDLNRVFTPEGRAEALERAYDTPSDWDGRSPIAPAASPQMAQPAAPVVDDQDDQGQQPSFPIDPRFEQVRSMVQGVVQQNQNLQQQNQQFVQQQQQIRDAQRAAEIARLIEEKPADALRLQDEWRQEREQQLLGWAQAEIQRRDAALAQTLVSGFTQEIIATHPDLTDVEAQLLDTIPDPDHRAQWADYFQGQHEANRQAALQQGATLHAASGVGAGIGAVPAGASSGAPNGRESSYDIIRRTPWQTIPG